TIRIQTGKGEIFPPTCKFHTSPYYQSAMAVAVEIQQLHFSHDSQPVLQNIDLAIERGSTLGLVGPNGGGKTTLVKLLLGLLKPSRGKIQVGGLSPAQAVRRGDVIGYLPQNPPLPSSLPLSVRQVVRLGLAGKTGILRPYAKSDLAFAESLLEKVGVADLADK